MADVRTEVAEQSHLPFVCFASRVEDRGLVLEPELADGLPMAFRPVVDDGRAGLHESVRNLV